QRTAAEDIDAPEGGYDMIMAHSILHLVADPAGLIQRMARFLKPGGQLVTSTACLSDGLSFFRVISSPGHALGLLPRITYLSRRDLRRMMAAARLDVHTDWRPGPRKAVFMIGRKPNAD
ncbi:MAG: methyltransferase domain-containing protein, partial [Sulfitobacter sp.]|nr:methyltransferase domain-containing protein [Sulfitobacter sp.]